MPKSDSDTSLDPVLELLRDVKRETKDTKKSVDNMNRELGGVQATLKGISDDNKKQDKQIADVVKIQLECPARAGHNAVNARLKRVDRRLDEESALYPNPAALGTAEVPWKEAFIKMLPLIIIAFVAGVGALAILFQKFGN